MRRDLPDYFLVASHHMEIHDRLLNWARWVKPRQPYWEHPMWRQGKSNSRQWHAPMVRETVDPLDAQKIEKAVGHLPAAIREAIRWHYVYCGNPQKMCRRLGTGESGLAEMVRRGRVMLLNRCA